VEPALAPGAAAAAGQKEPPASVEPALAPGAAAAAGQQPTDNSIKDSEPSDSDADDAKVSEQHTSSEERDDDDLKAIPRFAKVTCVLKAFGFENQDGANGVISMIRPSCRLLYPTILEGPEKKYLPTKPSGFLKDVACCKMCEKKRLEFKSQGLYIDESLVFCVLHSFGAMICGFKYYTYAK
jgi:hypothetical protein